MKLRKEQIKAIEKTADSLQQWREGAIPLELKMVGRHGQLIVMVQNSIGLVVVDLLSQMPELGKLIQDKFRDLLKQAKLVDSLDAEAAYFEDARLHGLTRQLAETLQQIAHNAREEISYEKPAEAEQKDTPSRGRRIIGWIVEGIIALALLVIFSYFFGLVTGILVFAALLAIFNYLGWLDAIRSLFTK